MAKEHKYHHSRIEIDTALTPEQALDYARQVAETVKAARYRGDYEGGVALEIKSVFGLSLIDYSVEAKTHGKRTHVVSTLDGYRTSQSTFMFVPVSPKTIEGYGEYKRYLRTLASVIAAADPTAIHVMVEQGAGGGIFDPALARASSPAGAAASAPHSGPHTPATPVPASPVSTAPAPVEQPPGEEPPVTTPSASLPHWTPEQATALVLDPGTSPDVLAAVVAEHPQLKFFADKHPSVAAAATAGSPVPPLAPPSGAPLPPPVGAAPPPIEAPATDQGSVAQLAGSPYASLSGPTMPAPVPIPTPTPVPAPVESVPVLPEPEPEPAPVESVPVLPEPPRTWAPPDTTPQPVVEPAPTATAEPENRAEPAIGLADEEEEEIDETVVVDRRRPITWTLVLDDGTILPLDSSHVLLGRKPLSTDPRTQALVVPDPTITLSKVHARLDLEDGTWTITDLNSTNGVILVNEDGTETLLSPGNPVAAPSRFVLGKVAMSIQQRTEQ